MKRNLLVVQNMIIGALKEGAEDQKHRQEAEKNADALVRAAKVGSIKPKLSMVKGDHRAVFDTSKLPGNVKKLIITSGPNVKSKFYLGILDGEQRIHIKIPDPNGTVTGEKNGFQEWIEADLGGFLAKYRNSLVHEYIHSIDVERVPDKRAVGADMSKPKTYFNDPLETNAYAQEGMSKFTQKLKFAHDKAMAKSIMGGTPQEFWKRLEKSMNPTFMAHISADNKKKLQKRSYQFWQDTLAKFEERK